MAYKTVKLQNRLTGCKRDAPLGFSWTMLFFGVLVPLYRRDYGRAFFIAFLSNAVLLIAWSTLIFGTVISIKIGFNPALLVAIAFVAPGLTHFILCSMYNEMYIKDLVSDGFTVVLKSEGEYRQEIERDVRQATVVKGLCPECGNDVSTTDSACSHCHAHIPMTPDELRALFGILMVVIVVCTMGYILFT